MNKSANPKHVLLTVDLKAEEPKLTERVWSVLKPLLKSGEAVVQPVTILNREDAAMGTYLKNRIGSLRAATERHLAEKLTELGVQGLAAPKVIFADGSSNQRAVMALLKYAKKVEADLIAVGSHSRQGVERLFLGSFAETLSLQSPIPLLVVNPNQRPIVERLNTVLFPTDFSEKSREGLDIVCNSLRGTKRKLVLFHSYVYPVQFYMDPFAAYPISQSMVDEEFNEMKAKGEEWCKELRGLGLNCKFIIDRKSLTAADGILAAMRREKAGMIAMVSATGKWGTRLLGSVTRQVLRSSMRPVWVVHPSESSNKNKVVTLRRPAAVKKPRFTVVAARH